MTPEQVKEANMWMDDRMKNHNIKGVAEFENCMKNDPKTEEECYYRNSDDCTKKKITTAWIQGKSTTEGIDCTGGGRRRRRTKRRGRRRTKRTKRRRTKRRSTKRKTKRRKKSKKRRRHRKR